MWVVSVFVCGGVSGGKGVGSVGVSAGIRGSVVGGGGVGSGRVYGWACGRECWCTWQCGYGWWACVGGRMDVSGGVRGGVGDGWVDVLV